MQFLTLLLFIRIPATAGGNTESRKKTIGLVRDLVREYTF